MITPPQTSMPRLAVVIPTVGRPSLIGTLDSLIRCRNAGRIEIIVAGRIDDPAVAGDFRLRSAGHASLRHLPVAFETGDSSRKKNAGAAEARANLVAFIDDDVKVGEDWIDHITAPFDDPAVGLVSGPSLVPEDINRMARLAGHALSSWAAGYVADRYRASGGAPHRARWSALIGCNMAFRRAVLAQLGGFDPSFWPGEEMLAAYRATCVLGHVLVFCPQAGLHHYPRATFTGFCRQMFGYGATRIRLVRAGVEKEWSTLIPAVLVVSLVGMSVSAWIWPRMGAWLSVGATAYLFVTFAVAWLKVRETRRWSDMGILFLIPFMHLSYGLGEWGEILRPGRDLGLGRTATHAREQKEGGA